MRRPFVFRKGRRVPPGGQTADFLGQTLETGLQPVYLLLLIVNTGAEVLDGRLLVGVAGLEFFQPRGNRINHGFLLDHRIKNADDGLVTHLHKPLLSAAFLLTLAACATAPPAGGGSDTIGKVLATGVGLIGQKPSARVTVNGKAFVLDCIGTVSAAWWGAGIDLQKDFRRYRGDGVNRLYESLKSWGALKREHSPRPGDLIIWDHTWDTGADPNFVSGHTHAGLVLSVGPDGTVKYLHESVTRGVVVAFMNLFEPNTARTPDGRVLNSPMFLGSNFGGSDNPPLWTSGQLWSAFGDGTSVSRAFGGW